MDQDVTRDGGHIVLDGDPAPPPKGAQPHSAHAYYGQTAGWVKMPLGMEVCLGSGYIVLVGDPAPPKKGTAPNFRPTFVVAKRLDGSKCHLVWR